MRYADFKDIHEFYDKTGMNREETFIFLLEELKRYEHAIDEIDKKLERMQNI